jgi:poly[(R)-3-hydroxyalkanoate] polymerase subunit PhaC
MDGLRFASRLETARARVGTTPSDEVLRENKWRLLRYRARPAGRNQATPVVLVPSLINRHYVLDLLPGKSFAEYLVHEGHDVFVIDWGKPGDEDRHLRLDTVCDRYLGRAVRAAARLAGVERVHLFGYCLGGTLAAIHAALHPERIATLTAVAAPIDFHDEGLLSRWTRTKTFSVRALVRALGNVPWPLMQASFHLLRPTLNLIKGVQLLDRMTDDEFLDGFFAIEAWGNDNVSFPGECYREYVEAMYRDNALVRGTFSIGGRRLELGDITAPVMAVTFEHDNIVPAASAAVLLARVGSAVREHVHMQGGHVGAMTSKKAAAALWPRMSAFWTAHSGAVGKPKRASRAASRGEAAPPA